MRTPDDTSSTVSEDRTRALGGRRGRGREQEDHDDRRRGRSAEGELVLDRYRLGSRIGAGGFGVVWSARDEKLERDVAVKAIPRDDGSPTSARVDREARAAARLNHPGIVALYELGSDDDDHYLVSELVSGATLSVLTREGAISDRDAARIGRALCDALAHAHARGVTHRDVKPGNVMVLAEPAAGSGFAKLTDFGIAHLATGEGITATGDVLGTLAYMAPEQAEGLEITGACDVYSLALTLYEVWTGSNPVRGATPAATARRVGRPLPSLAARRRDLPRELCDVIDDALEAEPELRPTPLELGGVLSDMIGELTEGGGLVERETQERFGITAAARTRRLLSTSPIARRRPADPDSVLARVGPRLLAGAAAGGLVLAACDLLTDEVVSGAPAAALAAGALTMLLPRLGWLAAALGVCVWLASPGVDQPGTAAVLAAALAPTPILLPRVGLLWSVPALAPLLGFAAVAPLFVGVAALATSAWRRAALGACGAFWLIVAELLGGRELLFGAPDAVPARAEWAGSVVAAAHDALWPLLSTPALAPVAVWLAFAVLLGLLLRGRFAVADLAVGALWATGLVLALGATGDLLAATTELERARGAVAGAGLGALVAVSVILCRPAASDEPVEPALP